MHERSYTPPFNLNGYESTITKNLLNLRERRTKLSKKEAGKRNVDLRFLRKFISVV
jgi:hypothetical protein